eukprot:6051957-Amphidinium_carterae.1
MWSGSFLRIPVDRHVEDEHPPYIGKSRSSYRCTVINIKKCTVSPIDGGCQDIVVGLHDWYVLCTYAWYINKRRRRLARDELRMLRGIDVLEKDESVTCSPPVAPLTDEKESIAYSPLLAPLADEKDESTTSSPPVALPLLADEKDESTTCSPLVAALADECKEESCDVLPSWPKRT